MRFFQRIQLAIAIADQLFDFLWQLARMRLAAVKSRDLVSATERVTDLIRSGESGAAKYENAKWLHGFLGKQRSSIIAVIQYTPLSPQTF